MGHQFDKVMSFKCLASLVPSVIEVSRDEGPDLVTYILFEWF